MSQVVKTVSVSKGKRETTNTINMNVEVVLLCVDENDPDANVDESDLSGDLESALIGALNVFYDVKSVGVKPA